MKATTQIAFSILLALLAGRAMADPLWAGAGGAPVPVEDDTPIVLELVSVSFAAIPPPRRLLDDLRFADQWEISLRIDMLNPTGDDVRLTLAVPVVPADREHAGGRIPEVSISQDGLRMPLAPERFEKLPDLGLPAEAFYAVTLEFAPRQRRRLDVMLRQPAPVTEGGGIVARWLARGLGRFAGETVPVQRCSWIFGERVRLVRGDLTSDIESAGIEQRFRDDGSNSRLDIEARGAAIWTGLDIEVRAVGPGTAPPDAALPGRTKPVADMNRTELAVARALMLAVHGRWLGAAPAARLFEELPWEPCNPAFRLARGESLPDDPIETLIGQAACLVDCRRHRARRADPFGDPWAAPLCWYSSVRNRSQTEIHEPVRRAALKDVEERLAAKPAAGNDGCGCVAVGRGSRMGLLGFLGKLVSR